MKKKLEIPKDFWKDFKDRKDFDEFFSDNLKDNLRMRKSLCKDPE